MKPYYMDKQINSFFRIHGFQSLHVCSAPFVLNVMIKIMKKKKDLISSLYSYSFISV